LNQILEEVGEFSKVADALFFVETKNGNFIWDTSSNTLTPEHRNYYRYLSDFVITKTRYRGKHKLSEYCGMDVKVIKE
jgi:hypothetical protein